MLRNAYAAGALADVVPALLAASRFAGSNGAHKPATDSSRLTTLATGPELPRLLCIPALLPGAGAHQFARFAGGFRGQREVAALSVPGFRPGDSCPPTWQAAVATTAELVSQSTGSEPFVLLGYSSGGVLAHAVAEQLAGQTPALEGVVTVDTYLCDAAELLEVFAEVLGEVLRRSQEYGEFDDDQVVAMGAYSGLLLEFAPEPLQVPSVLLRATRPLIRRDSGMGRTPWPADITVEVEGDHFSVIEHHADAAAHATANWLEHTFDCAPAS
jgi:pimeloyl-ACP methyl ester carboxylesterase